MFKKAVMILTIILMAGTVFATDYTVDETQFAEKEYAMFESEVLFRIAYIVEGLHNEKHTAEPIWNNGAMHLLRAYDFTGVINEYIYWNAAEFYIENLAETDEFFFEDETDNLHFEDTFEEYELNPEILESCFIEYHNSGEGFGSKVMEGMSEVTELLNQHRERVPVITVVNYEKMASFGENYHYSVVLIDVETSELLHFGFSGGWAE